MSRITLEDTLTTTLVKMAEGNPGAISAMMDILANHDKIDPQACFGGLGAVLMFDTWEIYGTQIYVLYNDKCHRDVRRLLMLMRATQLGLFPQHRLNEMANDQSRKINLTEEEFGKLDAQVCSQLSEFQKAS